ncbi:uncharacterized protein JCM6883_003638 [Sporobolomyces salmoneus]|uniref:uncharacterized protein n=1 Tax=Sporobolomyces salmoneus TaxID=183962 RepID=UPI00316C2CCD
MMFFFSSLSLSLISLVSLVFAQGVRVSTSPRDNQIVAGSYIIELDTPSSSETLSKRASAEGGGLDVSSLLSSVLTHLAQPVTTTIESLSGGGGGGGSSSSQRPSEVTLPKFSKRREFKSLPHVFAGAVVAAEDLATNEKGEEANWEDVVKGLETIKGVKRAWPVRFVPRPEPVYQPDEVFRNNSRKYVTHSAYNPTVRNSPEDYKNDQFPPHQMTGVDQLHERGILGDGVKVGVIDTGVDYKNPILGGCFGSGCHVSFGKAFVDDQGNSNDSPDPYTDCNEHGTHVSGIIGALANNYGFSGVAPHVELGMYRVFGCSGSSADDIIVDALLQSISDNCDVVSLSLGGSAGWLDQSPSQTIIERMNKMGIFTTVSAGNDRSEGLWYANGPASTRTGISVGSVDVVSLPAYFANLIGRPPIPYLSALPLDLSTLPSNQLQVYFTSTDSSITNDACSTLPSSTPNLANFVTVVQRGTCTFDQKMRNVAAKGGKVVLVYNSATADSAVPYLTVDGTGIVAVGSLRRQEGLRLLSYFEQNPRGLRIGFSPSDKPTAVEDTISGGIMSYYSEFGPTFDMFGQPSFSAPGGNILSTFPLSMGGLGVLSGTSMACPHAAGAVALLLSQRKAEGLSPLDVRSIYATTAISVPTTRGGSVASSIVLQGGGLIQAAMGIASGSIVSPFELQLNDTTFLHGNQEVTIKNTNNFPVTYTFSSSNAVALGTYDQSFRTDVLPSTSPSSVSGANARVSFSTSVLVVDAGATSTVTVTINPPRLSRSLSERFPIYSGFVDISGSAPGWGETNEELAVPFFGLVARMSDMPVLDSTARVYGEMKYPFLTGSDGNYLNSPATLSINRAITVYTRLAGGTRLLTIDLVNANVSFTPTISTDRRVESGSSTRMRLTRRDPDLGVVNQDSSAPFDVDLDEGSPSGIYSFVSLADGSEPGSLAASNNKPLLYKDTPIVGNILTQGLSPRDALVSNSPNPASDTRTVLAPNSYGFVRSGQQYRILVRALKITADPVLASSYESWISYPIVFR